MNLGRLRLGLPLLVRPGAEEEEEEAGEALSRGFHDPKFPLESILPASVRRYQLEILRLLSETWRDNGKRVPCTCSQTWESFSLILPQIK